MVIDFKFKYLFLLKLIIMIVGYILLTCLVVISISKMMETWELSAQVVGKKPPLVVRGYFGMFNFISDLVSLKIFK
tara:strand:+ start:325 stop:552 length:228 start_codon:yes stop_codon:yes gene_type:complete